MLSYPSTIPLSSSTLRYLADLLRGQRRRLNSPWRRLSAHRQSLLVLAHLRNGDTYERLACGFAIGVATVCRYVHEVVDLLADQAPSLRAVMSRMAFSRSNYLVLDGTVVPSNRITAYDRMYYSGKHHHHGLNVQGLIDHTGQLVWVSEGLPGSVHDLAAARTHQVLSACQRADLVVLADKGYHGDNCGALTPYRGRALPGSAHAANKAHAHIRGQGERGFATLTTWHILDTLRCCLRRAARYPQAILALELES